MKILNQKNSNFFNKLKKLIEYRIDFTSNSIDLSVKNIINEVRKRGDDALVDFVKKYDNAVISKSQILISEKNKKYYTPN